ncbi:MAG: redoxin domain-containing protein [Pseudomonadota bacterium]
MHLRIAPPLQVSQWFNTDQALSLETLRGKIIVLSAFQILCPGCVHHSVPQMQRIFDLFDTEDVAVIGLHTVFEDHARMNPAALAAFIAQHHLTLPVAVDMEDGQNGLPLTMRAYQMQGTPSFILIDKNGLVRMHRFGQKDDLSIGAAIGQILSE